jgi:hypothetical protein
MARAWSISTAVPPGGCGIRDQFGGDLPSQFERRLPAEGDDHPFGTLRLDHVEHILSGERLEVEPITGVVVGRHRLGIAVEHDRFEPCLAQ